MSDIVWETFDGLFKTLHRQGRRVEELEQRVVELERRLQERPQAGGEFCSVCCVRPNEEIPAAAVTCPACGRQTLKTPEG